MRVWIDGKLVIDDWPSHSARERAADITLSAGSHSVKVEYFEGRGSVVVEFW